jgi:hypothetical protein
MPVKLRVPASSTTDNAERIKGISNAISWCNALNPPMNGYLLLLAHENKSSIRGKNPKIAKIAITPTFKSATTQPGATGIRAVTAAADATKAIGAAQKIGLSAPDGIMISFDTSFKPSASNCRIPSILPQYYGPTLSCIFARNFRSTKIVTAAISAAYVKPGNTATLKRSVCIRN